VHCTELPDLACARRFGEKIHYRASGTGNSGHYYIDRDGHTQQWVPPDRVAHHVRGHNETSIGVELVNRGRYPNWFEQAAQAKHEPYPEAQIAALLALIADLGLRLPSLRFIAGHEELDRGRVAASDDPDKQVWRKRDPGPTFPWPVVESACALERYPVDNHGA